MAARPHFQKLVEKTRMQAPLPAAVVYPCDRESLQLALSGAFAGYLAPTLVGPETRIRDLAGKFGLDISRLDDRRYARRSAGRPAFAPSNWPGKARCPALIKGSLGNEDLLAPVAAHDSGLRTDRRLSHAFFLDLPGMSRGLLLADAQLNVSPNLAAKKDIVLNTIQLAISLGLAAPNVALLAAMDGPAPAFPSTTDAVALKSMAAQGMFRGAIVDGPLTPDSALSGDAARANGVDVGGRRARRRADRAVDGIGAHGAAHADGVRCRPRRGHRARRARSHRHSRAQRFDGSAHGVLRARVARRSAVGEAAKSQACAGSPVVAEANSQVAA